MCNSKVAPLTRTCEYSTTLSEHGYTVVDALELKSPYASDRNDGKSAQTGPREPAAGASPLPDQPFQLSRARNLKLAAPVRLRAPHQLAHPRLGIERLAPPSDFEPATIVESATGNVAVPRPRLLPRRTIRRREVVTGRFPHPERFREVAEVDRLEVEQVLLGRRVGRVRSDVRLERFASERSRLRASARGGGLVSIERERRDTHVLVP